MKNYMKWGRIIWKYCIMTWAPDYEDKNSSKSLPRNIRLKTFRDSLILDERYLFSLLRRAWSNRKPRENMLRELLRVQPLLSNDEHVSTWAGHVDFGLSFHVLSIVLDSFAVEFWGWVVLYSIVLSSMHDRSYLNVRSGSRGACGRNPFNQNFRAEVRNFLGFEWIAIGPSGLVPFHS